MKNIIAIQGYKNSGKDTAAEMMQYLLNNPKWMHKYWMYKLLENKSYSKKKFHIVRYADKLKEMLATLLNVDVLKFEDREFKERHYIDFNTLTIWPLGAFNEDKILSENEFSKRLKNDDYYDLTDNYFLSVRQTLQFFGTEVMRTFFGDQLWILSTLKTKYPNIIISDQRFIVENSTAYDHNASIFHIVRPGCKPGTHSSEYELQWLEENQKYDEMIHNDDSLKVLFYQCKYALKQTNRI